MPLVEDLSNQLSERLKVVKVNAQENRRLCVELKVLSLPTFLFFNQGQEMGRLTGDIKAHELQPWVESQLANGSDASSGR
jgi:thioredoxin 1